MLSITINLSSFSFEIYVFHKMFLEVLYYRTHMPYFLGMYELLWVSVAMYFLYFLPIYLNSLNWGKICWDERKE